MEHVASTMERLMSEDVKHRRLFLIQTYNIGKERAFIEVWLSKLECCANTSLMYKQSLWGACRAI